MAKWRMVAGQSLPWGRAIGQGVYWGHRRHCFAGTGGIHLGSFFNFAHEGASAHRARAPCAPRAPRAEADASLTGEMHTFFRQVFCEMLQ